MTSQTVSVVGLGYIGLPMALLLARAGHRVQGFDITQAKVNQLNNGKLYFSEPGLDELFAEVRALQTFSAGTTLQPADTFIVAVPTPQHNGAADLSFVHSALAAIKQVFRPGNLVIIESTIGPRDAVDVLIPEITGWGMEFSFAYCPERAIPGSTLNEMVNNDRIIGSEDQVSLDKAKQLYSSFVTGELLTTSTTVAASCKVMENTYRAVNIALANELAVLADQLQFDVWEAIKLANHHPRVKLHQPGPGVGGHCIPIDPWFFVSHSQRPSLIERALTLNDQMGQYVANQVKGLIEELGLTNPVIGILGYAYKPNVDDARETPTEHILHHLVGLTTLVSDPHVTQTHTTTQLKPEAEVLAQADVVIIATAHAHYHNLDFNHCPKLKLIYDCHNCLPMASYAASQVPYRALGKPPAPSTK
jgi:nucleotide sugar dehydrogenase